MSIEHDNSTTNQQVNPNVHGTDPAGSVEGASIPGSHLSPDTHEQVAHGNVPPVIEAAAASADTQPINRSALGHVASAGGATVERDPASNHFVGSVPSTGQAAHAVAPAAPEKKSRRGLWGGIAAGVGFLVAGTVFYLAHGGSADQRVSSEHDNQGDTKATSQAAAPTAGEASPTSAAETQETPAAVNYTIDTVAANADPKAYYAAYAAQLGMQYADNSNLDKYFALSDAGKNGEVDQQTANTEMETFLNEQLGNNLNQFANALYQNPGLTPKEQADLTAQLAPYVFDTENNPQLETAVKQFAGKIVAAAPAGGSLQGYFAPGSSLGTETTTFLGVLRLDEKGQPDNNFIGPELDDESGKTLYLVGRPGFTDSSATSHFSLRQVSPQG